MCSTQNLSEQSAIQKISHELAWLLRKIHNARHQAYQFNSYPLVVYIPSIRVGFAVLSRFESVQLKRRELIANFIEHIFSRSISFIIPDVRAFVCVCVFFSVPPSKCVSRGRSIINGRKKERIAKYNDATRPSETHHEKTNPKMDLRPISHTVPPSASRSPN